MHEQNIVEPLLALAIKHAKEANAQRILRIYLVVGEYSGVVEESVEFYFKVLSKKTIAENASLFFMRVPAQLKCRNCDTVFQAEKLNFHCPNCNKQEVEITSGRELFIDSMDVE